MKWLSACCALWLMLVPAAQATRLVVAGDSTASAYGPDRYPRSGWGQLLPDFLVADVTVLNRAVSGRSTRSFRDQGLWDALLAELQSGDRVLIQFGHNDQKREDPARFSDSVEFAARLAAFVDDVRARGAKPVLLTPVARRSFDADGRPVDTHGEYAAATRALAARKQVPLIDLARLSMDWLEALGPEASKAWYLYDADSGLADDTHFHHRGAAAVACMVLGELRRQALLEAAELRRDVDCGVPMDQRERHARQVRPSLIEHAEAIAEVQPAPHGGDGLTLGASFFQDAPDLGLVVRQRVLHRGASIGLHAHGKDEIYYIVSGRGELSLDGQLKALLPGMAVLTRDGSSHSLRQVGADDLVLLIVYQRTSE